MTQLLKWRLSNLAQALVIVFNFALALINVSNFAPICNHDDCAILRNIT